MVCVANAAAGSNFLERLRTVRIFHVGKNLLAIVLCSSKKQFQKKVLMSNSQFASLSLVNVKGTRMEVSSRLKMTECCKEFRRFVGTRVETSRPRRRCCASKCLQRKRNHGRSGRSFTCSSEKTAAQAKGCRTVASK